MEYHIQTTGPHSINTIIISGGERAKGKERETIMGKARRICDRKKKGRNGRRGWASSENSSSVRQNWMRDGREGRCCASVIRVTGWFCCFSPFDRFADGDGVAQIVETSDLESKVPEVKPFEFWHWLDCSNLDVPVVWSQVKTKPRSSTTWVLYGKHSIQ